MCLVLQTTEVTHIITTLYGVIARNVLRGNASTNLAIRPMVAPRLELGLPFINHRRNRSIRYAIIFSREKSETSVKKYRKCWTRTNSLYNDSVMRKPVMLISEVTHLNHYAT